MYCLLSKNKENDLAIIPFLIFTNFRSFSSILLGRVYLPIPHYPSSVS